MPKPSDTKQRILDVARDLFTTQGVQRTSLQDIADRLGITKPALYYHFPSRDDLVRSIVAPMLDDGEQFLLAQEARGDAPVRELVEGFFDFNYRHRADVIMLLAEMPTLADLGLIDKTLGWRTRLTALICGPSPTLERQAGPSSRSAACRTSACSSPTPPSRNSKPPRSPAPSTPSGANAPPHAR